MESPWICTAGNEALQSSPLCLQVGRHKFLQTSMCSNTVMLILENPLSMLTATAVCDQEESEEHECRKAAELDPADASIVQLQRDAEGKLLKTQGEKYSEDAS